MLMYVHQGPLSGRNTLGVSPVPKRISLSLSETGDNRDLSCAMMAVFKTEICCLTLISELWTAEEEGGKTEEKRQERERKQLPDAVRIMADLNGIAPLS
jgi:hypothetical protein